MAIDISTNRIASSLTGVADASVLNQYIQAGIQETFRARNIMGQFFADISSVMANVEVGYTYRDKTSSTVAGDMTVSSNQVLYDNTAANRGSPSVDRVRHAWEKEKNWQYVNADITQQQMAEHPMNLITIMSRSIGVSLAAGIDKYREACLAGALPTSAAEAGRTTTTPVTSAEATYWHGVLDSVDNLDGTTTNDQSQFLGSSTQYIPANGREEMGANDDPMLLTLLEDLQLRWELANKAGYAAGGDVVFTMLVSPIDFFALERSVDDLGNNLYEIQRIEGGEKRLWYGNIVVVSSNHLVERNVLESSGKVSLAASPTGTKKARPIHMIASGALGYAQRFDTLAQFAPGQHTTGPYTRIDFSRQRQAWVLDPRLWERRWIPAEARS